MSLTGSGTQFKKSYVISGSRACSVLGFCVAVQCIAITFHTNRKSSSILPGSPQKLFYDIIYFSSTSVQYLKMLWLGFNTGIPQVRFSHTTPVPVVSFHYCIFHVTLPNQEIDLIHHKNSKAHISISSLRIHLKLKTWSIRCIYLMFVPLLFSYITFPRLCFLLPDFEGFESSNSSQMCKSS